MAKKKNKEENYEGLIFLSYEGGYAQYEVIYDFKEGEDIEDRGIFQELILVDRSVVDFENRILNDEGYLVKWAGESRQDTTLLMDDSGHIQLVNLYEKFPKGVLVLSRSLPEYQVLYSEKGFFAGEANYKVTKKKYKNLDDFYRDKKMNKKSVEARLIKSFNNLMER